MMIFHMIQSSVTTMIKQVKKKGSFPGCPRIHYNSNGRYAVYLSGEDTTFTKLKALTSQDLFLGIIISKQMIRFLKNKVT